MFRGMKIRESVFSVVIALSLLYLTFHALNGDYGVYALIKESVKREKIEQTQRQLTKERETLEHKVALLSGKTIDLDLLDEQTRRVLGYTDAQELIYPYE